MSMQRGGGPASDVLVNLALGAIAAVAGLALVLRGAASVAAWLSGLPQPDGDIASGLAVLLDPLNPAEATGTPGLNAIVFWLVAGLMLAVLTTGVAFGVVKWRSRSRRRDPRRLEGTATGSDIAQTASTRALQKRSANLRPSLGKQAKPAEVGYLIGTAKGQRVWASVEDSILVLGPPRAGKGYYLAGNFILDAPGSVVTTSTRPDNLAITLRARRRLGPVAVFDPQRLAPGLPAGLRWSPVRGCEDPLTAMIRASGFAASTGLSGGGVDSGGFWEGKTREAIQALLHAAALGGLDARNLYRWTLSPAAAADAVRILAAEPNAAEGWADSLDSMIQADPRTRDSIWQGVSLAFSAFADPRVLAAVTPAPGEVFDPTPFLQERGTLMMLATGAGAGAAGALVAAFIEDIVETARRMAARSPGARLDPPLALVLDEIGNLSPLPSLPTLMAEGGGSGITTMPFLQSLAQARDKWGQEKAGAIWDSAIVKILLGGQANPKDLQDISNLLGERDDTTMSVSHDAFGARSYQSSIRRVPVMSGEELRTMPFGVALTLLRAVPPIVTDLRAWTARPDADLLRADQREIQAILQAAE
ncbi:MAG: type VI secretion protein [Microbacterium sp.]|nr:type VI secretion protein [Microbacterium sp.]